MDGIRNAKLVLLRHGESAFNEDDLFSGWADCPLTVEGVRQAHEAGRILRDEGMTFDVCFTSVLSRAMETADIVLGEMGAVGIPVIRTWKLNERHYGALEGTSKSEAVTRYGADTVEAWRNAADAVPPPISDDDDRHPRFKDAYRDVPREMLPCTECLSAAFQRVFDCFDDEILPLLKEGKRVLVVSHGNPLRAILARLDGKTANDIPRIAIGNATPIVCLPEKFKSE